MAVRLTSSTSRLQRDTGLVAASSSYTSMCWFRSTTTPSGGDYKTVFASLNDPTYDEWAGVFTGTNNLQVSLSFPAASQGPSTLIEDGWYHLAYTRTGSFHRFYINGNPVSGSFLIENISAFVFTLLVLGYDGFSDDDGSEYAYWREWNVGLTAAQVNQEYRSTTAVKTSNLWADTPLTSDLVDLSGNGRDWVASGTTSFVANPVLPTPGVYTVLYPVSWFSPPNQPPWFFPSVFRAGWDRNPTIASDCCLVGYVAGTNTSLVTVTDADPAPIKLGMYRWSTTGLLAQVISGTFDLVLGAVESNAAANFFLKVYMYVTVGESDTVRGVLLDYTDATELPTTAQGISLTAPQTLTPLVVEAGDTLVVELGVFANNAVLTSYTASVYAGGAFGSVPLTVGSTNVTTERGTFLFSNGIAIDDPAVEPGDAVSGNEQLYVYDKTTGELKRIILESGTAGGTPDPANGLTFADGTWVFPTEEVGSHLIFMDRNFIVTNIVAGGGARGRSLTLDGQENIYVGFRGDVNVNPTGTTYYPRKFDRNGTLLASYAVTRGTAGPSSIDLKADQKTLVYVCRDRVIRAFDVLNNVQLPDIVTLPTETGPTYNVAARAYGIRNLIDGGYLVADLIDIKRLDSSGNIVKRYSEPNVEDWQSVTVGLGWSSFVSATIGAPDSSAIASSANPNVQGASGPGTPLAIKWDIATGAKIFELLEDVDPDTGGSQRGFSTTDGPTTGTFNAPPGLGTPRVYPIRRVRRSPHVFMDNKRVFLSRLEPYLRAGIGTPTGQGIDALVMLRVSKDGGNTWGAQRVLSAGTLGRYTKQLQAYRFGQARDWVFEVSVTDPCVPWVLMDLFADLETEA